MTLFGVVLLAAGALQAPLRAGRHAQSPGRGRRLLNVATGEAAPAPSSLETKLLEEHAASCKRAAAVFGIADDATPGRYDRGWESRTLPPSAVSEGNTPYGSDELLRLSQAPLLSEDECERLIELMEAHGASNGWDARYPVTGYTREVNVADIDEAAALLREALSATLLPAVSDQFPFAASSLRCNEAIIVKYDATSGHNCLPVHQDFSLLTYNVALAPSSTYQGGGTWFQSAGRLQISPRLTLRRLT